MQYYSRTTKVTVQKLVQKYQTFMRNATKKESLINTIIHLLLGLFRSSTAESGSIVKQDCP